MTRLAEQEDSDEDDVMDPYSVAGYDELGFLRMDLATVQSPDHRCMPQDNPKKRVLFSEVTEVIDSAKDSPKRMPISYRPSKRYKKDEYCAPSMETDDDLDETITEMSFVAGSEMLPNLEDEDEFCEIGGQKYKTF